MDIFASCLKYLHPPH